MYQLMTVNFISDSSDSSEDEPSFVEGFLDQRVNSRGVVEFLVKWSKDSPKWEDSKQFFQDSKLIAYFLRDKFVPQGMEKSDAESQTDPCFNFKNPTPLKMTSTKEVNLETGSDISMPEIPSVPIKIDQISQNIVFYIDNNSKNCTMNAKLFSEEYPALFSNFIMQRIASKQ